VAKFSGHVLRHLASRLANVIRQGESQTKKLNFKNPYSSFYNCIVLCTIYLGLVTSKQFNKGTFRRVICLSMPKGAAHAHNFGLLKLLLLSYHHSHSWAATLDFTTFSCLFLHGPHLFVQLGCFCVDFTS